MTRAALKGALIAACALGFGCGEDDPPPPSTPPQLSEPQVKCGPMSEAMAQLYEVDYPVILEVSVHATDAERDLTRVDGDVNGYPMNDLRDVSADLRHAWVPPAEEAPLVCRGEIVVRFVATDRDGNTSELREIITK